MRFNWPMLSLSTVIAALLFTQTGRLPPVWRWGCWMTASIIAWFVVASLIGTWLAYDRSCLHRWTWLDRCVQRAPHRWLAVHAGLDEASAALAEIFPATEGRTLDIYDPQLMSEPSIARARISTSAPPAHVRHDALPVEDASIDLAMVFLAAHELRHPDHRRALFRELRRSLAGDGRVVVVEHCRDLGNVLLYGPGAWHFLPLREWTSVFADAGLALVGRFRIARLVTVFVLRS